MRLLAIIWSRLENNEICSYKESWKYQNEGKELIFKYNPLGSGVFTLGFSFTQEAFHTKKSFAQSAIAWWNFCPRFIAPLSISHLHLIIAINTCQYGWFPLLCEVYHCFWCNCLAWVVGYLTYIWCHHSWWKLMGLGVKFPCLQSLVATGWWIMRLYCHSKMMTEIRWKISFEMGLSPLIVDCAKSVRHLSHLDFLCWVT